MAPAASADPFTKFTDNPSIVDSHPLHFESWRVVGEDVVALQFITGTPECFGVHAIACIMIAVFGSLDVHLREPLGDREVISL